MRKRARTGNIFRIRTTMKQWHYFSAVTITIALVSALVVAVGGLARPTVAFAQAEPTATRERRITVVGQGEVAVQPDEATVHVGVVTEAETPGDALAQNNERMRAIRTKLTELGIADDVIETGNFSIYPMRQPPRPAAGSQTEETTGYRVRNMLNVTVTELDQLGEILDQVVQAGANSVQGISFAVSDAKALMDEARRKAVENARTQAEHLADAAGATIGQVLVIDGSGSNAGPRALAAGSARGGAVPIAPGEQTIRARVHVTYALND